MWGGTEGGAFRMPVETLSTRELLPCHLGVHALLVGSMKSSGLVVFSEHASDHHLIRMVNASQLVLRCVVSGLSIRIRVPDDLHSTAHHRHVGLAEVPTTTPILYGLTVGSLFMDLSFGNVQSVNGRWEEFCIWIKQENSFNNTLS